MADEQEKPAKEKGPWEGLTVQMFFGALASAWMIWQESKGNTYRAGLETYLGTIGTGLAYVAYWLVKPRLMKWRKG